MLRSLYSKFGVIEAASGVITWPVLSTTRKSLPATELGSTGQLNSIGKPSVYFTG